MKRVIVYTLLLIFILQTSKSLWIVASFQFNKEYISKNLCINRFDKIPTCKGQCFLNKQLAKEQSENKKNQNTISKEVLYTIPHLIVFNLHTSTRAILKQISSKYQSKKYTSFLFDFENPPEIIV